MASEKYTSASPGYVSSRESSSAPRTKTGAIDRYALVRGKGGGYSPSVKITGRAEVTGDLQDTIERGKTYDRMSNREGAYLPGETPQTITQYQVSNQYQTGKVILSESAGERAIAKAQKEQEIYEIKKQLLERYNRKQYRKAVGFAYGESELIEKTSLNRQAERMRKRAEEEKNLVSERAEKIIEREKTLEFYAAKQRERLGIKEGTLVKYSYPQIYFAEKKGLIKKEGGLYKTAVVGSELGYATTFGILSSTPAHIAMVADKAVLEGQAYVIGSEMQQYQAGRRSFRSLMTPQGQQMGYEQQRQREAFIKATSPFLIDKKPPLREQYTTYTRGKEGIITTTRETRTTPQTTIKYNPEGAVNVAFASLVALPIALKGSAPKQPTIKPPKTTGEITTDIKVRGTQTQYYTTRGKQRSVLPVDSFFLLEFDMKAVKKGVSDIPTRLIKTPDGFTFKEQKVGDVTYRWSSSPKSEIGKLKEYKAGKLIGEKSVTISPEVPEPFVVFEKLITQKGQVKLSVPKEIPNVLIQTKQGLDIMQAPKNILYQTREYQSSQRIKGMIGDKQIAEGYLTITTQAQKLSRAGISKTGTLTSGGFNKVIFKLEGIAQNRPIYSIAGKIAYLENKINWRMFETELRLAPEGQYVSRPSLISETKYNKVTNKYLTTFDKQAPIQSTYLIQSDIVGKMKVFKIVDVEGKINKILPGEFPAELNKQIGYTPLKVYKPSVVLDESTLPSSFRFSEAFNLPRGQPSSFRLRLGKKGQQTIYGGSEYKQQYISRLAPIKGIDISLNNLFFESYQQRRVSSPLFILGKKTSYTLGESPVLAQETPFKSIEMIKYSAKDKIKEIFKQKIISKQAQEQASIFKQAQPQRQAVQQINRVREIQETKLIQEQAIQPVVRMRNFVDVPVKIINIKPDVPFFIPPFIPGRIAPRERKQEQQGFNVFVRRKGVFGRVNIGSPLIRKEAIGLGSWIVGRTAAASFKIEKAFGNVPLGKEARKGKLKDFMKKRGIYIEKRSRRIKSKGELREITYKGIMASRAKRRK